MRRLLLSLGLVAIVAGGSATADATPVRPGALVREVAVPAQVDSLEIDAATTYRLEPDAGVVQVTIVATLTNTAPSRRRGDFIETPFYDSFGSAAIGPVANVTADRDGTPLRTTVETGDSADVEFVVVDLSPNLVFGSPQTITIRYDIPAQPSRSDFATRINDAFASWYAVGTGSSGAIDLVVDVPERFEVEFTDIPSVVADVADGRLVFRFDDLDENASFSGVSARDDDALVKKRTTVDDDAFEIQAWPGDEAWADFAVDAVDRGVPALVERTGLPLADEREIAIAETATPYLYGYAGWFLPGEDRIEIGDELELQVMLHELAHLWFNFDLFDSRWINEGLAEVVSNDIARSFDVPALDVAPIDPAAPGAQPLNEWVNPGADEDAEAIENYGYATAYAVMQALVDDIGPDGLRVLVAHADAGLVPYVGDPDPEESFGAVDWRYLYDLADRVVGSERVATLFDEHVLGEEDRPAVAARAAAVERYEALAAEGGVLSPPLEVRRRMAAWSFERAGTAIDEAGVLLTSFDRLTAELAERSVPLPAALEESYESAPDLDDTSDLFVELDDVASAVVDADVAADDIDPIEWIGLIGTDVGGRRDAALAAFDAGDADDAGERAGAVLSSTDGARVAAAVRIAALSLLVAVGVVVLRHLRRWNRERTERRRLRAMSTLETLPALEIEGHTPSQPQGADHPMRIMTRRAAGLVDPPWDQAARAEVATLFDSLAPEWHTRTSESRAQVVLDALDRGGVRGSTVLEVGSGIGAYSGALAERFSRVLALDLSMEMLRLAGDEPGLRVLADSATLPVPDGSVDAVVLINMLLFPAEVDRVLAPGGTVVWVNSSGESTPIHLLPDEVADALPGPWTGVSSRAGVGLWAVLRRDGLQRE